MRRDVGAKQDHADRDRHPGTAPDDRDDDRDPREEHVRRWAAQVRDEVGEPDHSPVVGDVEEAEQHRLVGALRQADMERGQPGQKQARERDRRRGKGRPGCQSRGHAAEVSPRLWRP